MKGLGSSIKMSSYKMSGYKMSSVIFLVMVLLIALALSNVPMLIINRPSSMPIRIEGLTGGAPEEEKKKEPSQEPSQEPLQEGMPDKNKKKKN